MAAACCVRSFRPRRSRSFGHRGSRHPCGTSWASGSAPTCTLLDFRCGRRQKGRDGETVPVGEGAKAAMTGCTTHVFVCTEVMTGAAIVSCLRFATGGLLAGLFPQRTPAPPLVPLPRDCVNLQTAIWRSQWSPVPRFPTGY